LHKNAAAEWFGLTSGGFWPFASKLSKEMGCDDYSNLAWTNLCKIGMNTKNPSPELVYAQEHLAVRTLRSEIAAYRPSLVVLVTNNFAKEILMEAVDGQELDFWSKSENETARDVQDIWWHEGDANSPAILWMRHPQGAPSDQTLYAISKARELTTN
jgi:hypothetical protein